MFNWIRKQPLLIASLVTICASWQVQATALSQDISAAEILSIADDYRLEDAASKVVTQVALYQDASSIRPANMKST